MKYILMMNTSERGAYSIFNWPKRTSRRTWRTGRA
jgi:hypothetical protein